jgi:dihydrofolate synthase/folylpolyglutamate synthase
MKQSYIQLLRQLYKVNMYNPVKLGLENMEKLNHLLNNPLKSIPVVHVTGTNGKGSVSLKIANALSACGIRTGLFTSPHISSFKERISIDGELITEEEVETFLPHIFELCLEHNIPATFFELTTALAFQKFSSAKCDAVVLEVGIGGRLDATNIVTPILSIITSVQLDHVSILGDTIEKIAFEKAGIIKPSIPILIGRHCPEQQLRVRLYCYYCS